MLLGLKINGEPVTGRTEIPWDTIESVLGSALTKRGRDGLSIKLSWLHKYITGNGMPGPPSDLHLFRTYVFYLIGTRLMPNYTGNLVHLKWLPLLNKSPQEVGQYSWGSACLAVVYRSLCEAAEFGVNKFEGCTLLLQAWAYSRMICIAPVPRNPPPAETLPPLANM